MNRDTDPYGDQEVEDRLAQRTANRRSSWSRIEPRYRYAIIGVSVFAVVLIAGIVIAIVLTRKGGTPVPPVTSAGPAASTSVQPVQTRSLLLKDPSSGDCFTFPSFAPVMGSPGACNTGIWVQNETEETLSFDSTSQPPFIYCIQRPGRVSTNVLGSTGSGCIGVFIDGDKIRASKTSDETEDVCINDVFGDIQWGDCGTAFAFDVAYIS